MAMTKKKPKKRKGGYRHLRVSVIPLLALLATLTSVTVSFAQTATPTETPTITDTPTPTPTSTPTPTKTPTARAQEATGFDGQPAIGQANSADITATFSYTTGATRFWEGDTIDLVKIPQGAVVLEWYISCPDLDSSTSLTIDFGTPDDTDKFLSDSTICRAVSKSTSWSGPNGLVANALPATFTDDDEIVITVTAAANPTPPAGGVLSGWVRYNMLGDAF